MHVCFSSQRIKENKNPNLECHQNQNSNSEDEESDFWEKPCAFTPESRLEAHRHLEEKRRAKARERYTSSEKEVEPEKEGGWSKKHVEGGKKNKHSTRIGYSFSGLQFIFSPYL